jgi:S-formylglutathione hydrolase FrmB
MTSNSTRFLLRPGLSLVALVCAVGWAQPGAEKAGTVDKIKVHGASLEGNLEGDPAERDVFVYLPPSYASQPNRRYPVVYFLHGYGATAEAYWKLMVVPDAASKVMNAGTVHEMILVHPDAHTLYDGSMYSNSPTTGGDVHRARPGCLYRQPLPYDCQSRQPRLGGPFDGGYGTLRLAMKYPEVYSSFYAMSSCCLMNNPGVVPPRPAPAQNSNTQSAEGQAPRRNPFANVNSAMAAAWSPDPMNPPKFFDLPVEGETVHPEIVAKWVANSPLAFVDQYLPNLRNYRAIKLDVGDQDNLAATNKQMDQSLTRLGIVHTFEVYEGNHGNRVKERFETKVLPFFSENLNGQASQGSR